MKKILLAIFTLYCLPSIGQQSPQYTHFILNYVAINPAVVGSTPCFDLKIGYRMQWQGFEGSPRTAFANGHAKFGENKGNFHGLGGIVESDDTGPLGFTAMHLAYAYHMRTSRRYRLSLGLSAGFNQYRVDYGGMTLTNYDDPAIQNAVSEFVYPIINFGLWYYRDDRFYGFSVNNLTQNTIKGFGLDTKLKRHYFFAAGKSIDMNKEFQFKPAILVKYVQGSKMAVDLNAMVEYKEKFALGMSFRNQHGLSALLKMDVLKYITLAYAYDMTMNKLRPASVNTHEITLGIRACEIGAKGFVPCAAYN